VLGRSPIDFDLATSATPEEVLALFPRAIPIGLRHGTVMIPAAPGPIDVTHFRGATLDEDLAHRDFTFNAMALELGPPPRLRDPSGGSHDLRAGILRAPGDARERLAEDPLRALRAARFVAQLGVEPDAALRAALPEAAGGLANVAAERIRGELERLLLGEHVERGLALLRETGIESQLVAGVREDAAGVAGAVPAELPIRLAAWLRGTPAGARLARLRFPRRIAETVERWVAAHPADEWSTGAQHLRRLQRRLGEPGIEALLILRRAELAVSSEGSEARAAGEARLGRVETTLADLRRRGVLDVERATLAVDGDEVMRWLGCRPGPEVGRALRWLTERVAEDPARNERGTLRALLAEWRTPDTEG
jgi:tRNA nucleotidyltransferase (CCA-adding enzyme)